MVGHNVASNDRAGASSRASPVSTADAAGPVQVRGFRIEKRYSAWTRSSTPTTSAADAVSTSVHASGATAAGSSKPDTKGSPSLLMVDKNDFTSKRSKANSAGVV